MCVRLGRRTCRRQAGEDGCMFGVRQHAYYCHGFVRCRRQNEHPANVCFLCTTEGRLVALSGGKVCYGSKAEVPNEVGSCPRSRRTHPRATLALGVYPATGLRSARGARDAAKRILQQGIDPSQHRRAESARSAVPSTNTFDAIAAEVLEKKRRERKADRTITKFEWLMSLARPGIGSRQIADTSAPEVLAVLRQIEARGRYETARKLRGAIGHG